MSKEQKSESGFSKEVVDNHFKSRVDSYLAIFGPALRVMRQMQPELFSEELKKRKLEAMADFANRGKHPNASVEMIAMCKIDYEAELLEGKVSPFSSALLNFAKSNKVLNV